MPKHLNRELSTQKKSPRKKYMARSHSRKVIDLTGDSPKRWDKEMDITQYDVPDSIQTSNFMHSSEVSRLLPAVDVIEKLNFKYELKPDTQGRQNCFFLQDKQMHLFFKYYPEHVCIDKLCEIAELELSLYLFISADSNGHCEIVSMGLVKTGSLRGLSWLCEVFKNHNPNWRKIQFITTDKNADWMEIIKSSFPDQLVLISFFHSLKALKKELSNLENKVTNQDINKAIQIFEHMIFICNDSGFNDLMKQLKQLPGVIFALFKKSWLPKRDLWGLGLVFNSKMLLKLFNNFLLTIRKKVRPSVITQDTTEDIIKKLYSALMKMRKERFQKFTSVFLSASTSLCSKPNPSQKYSKFLTCYAAELVIEQLNNADEVKNMQKIYPGKYSVQGSDLLTTINSCSCIFYNSMLLPCSHIFSVRCHLSLPLFVDTMCSVRWILSTYKQTYLDIQNVFMTENNFSEDTEVTERFRKCFYMFSDLWPLFMECPENVSQQRVTIFQNLMTAWKSGLKVAVKAPDKQNLLPSSNEALDLPTDYWKEIYGISLKDILDSDNDFSSVSLCSETSNDLL